MIRLTLVLFTLFASAALADDYRSARAELVAAYQAQDFMTMVSAAEKALQARPDFPGALFNLAFAQVLNGEPENALESVRLLTALGVDFGVSDADEFSAIRELDGWSEIAVQIEALYEQVGDATVAARYEVGDFIPEGIAFDANGDLYLGSIRKGQLLRIDENNEIVSDRDGHWSVFGMRLHPDGTLWFASSAISQLENVGDDEGQAGLFRFDAAKGRITRSAILPAYADSQVLGDLVVADANTLYTTDSITGGIYRYNIDANEFEILIKPGKLVSPQGLTLDQTGGYLYVADYNGGLYRVSLITRTLAKVAAPIGASDYGIDGLYRHGNELIAIQNGVRPHRVVAFELDESGMAVSGHRTLASNLPEFDEPTLGVVQGGDFYFVANSHWNRFDAEDNLPDDLAGPVILKISLD